MGLPVRFLFCCPFDFGLPVFGLLVAGLRVVGLPAFDRLLFGLLAPFSRTACLYFD